MANLNTEYELIKGIRDDVGEIRTTTNSINREMGGVKEAIESQQERISTHDQKIDSIEIELATERGRRSARKISGSFKIPPLSSIKGLLLPVLVSFVVGVGGTSILVFQFIID